nr:helix-turn-helix domain-containing protein [Zoogloeaceae bacterium]
MKEFEGFSQSSTRPHPLDETFTIEQASEYLKVSSGTVERLIRSGELPACQIGRSYVLMHQYLRSYLIEETARQSMERRKPLMAAEGQLSRRAELDQQVALKSQQTKRGRPRKHSPFYGINSENS